MAEQVKTPNPFLRALSNRNFRLLWIGGSVSVLGSQFSMIALPWLVLQLTDDPQALGLVLALAGLPRALFILLGGAITDRFPPRKILLLCDWLNFGLSAMIAALVFTSTMQVWMIYIFAFITGLISGFVIPAANSITPLLLPDQDLQAGNSLSMGTSQLMGFIGPAMAGVIIGSYSQSIVGVALAFAFDSVTFAFSAFLLGMMRKVAREDLPRVEKHEESVWASIMVAARYLIRQESLRMLFLVMVVVNFLFTGPLLVGIPVLADQRLPQGAAAFGLLMSGYAGGNLLGFILAGGLPKPNGRVLRWVVITLIAGFGLALLAYGWIASTWVDFALTFLLGVGNGYIGLVLFTWIQQSTPRDMLGRIMSMTMLAGMGLVPFSQAIAGTLSKWNLTGLFVIAGGLLVLFSVWLVFQPALKHLSDQMLDIPAPANSQ